MLERFQLELEEAARRYRHGLAHEVAAKEEREVSEGTGRRTASASLGAGLTPEEVETVVRRAFALSYASHGEWGRGCRRTAPRPWRRRLPARRGEKA